MSRWSGLLVAGLVLILMVVALGQPVWQIRLSDPPQTDTWSYDLFGVTSGHVNSTSGSANESYTAYADLTNQPRLAKAFLDAKAVLVASVAADLAAIGLATLAGLRRIRGLYAGLALLAACFMSLYGSFSLIASIPEAATELPSLGGQPVFQFEGQIIAPGAGSASVILSWGPGLAWYLFLGSAVALAFGAAEVWSVHPRARTRPSPRPHPSEGPLPPPPPEKVEPLIEEVFVIGSNGLLIKHMSRSLMQDIDRDVVGGMIAVVSNFVHEAFPERDGSVREVILGHHRFVIAGDRGLVVAVLATRGEAEDIVHRLRHLLALLHERYGAQLDDWHGQSLAGIEDEIAVLWQPFFLPAPPID